MRRKPVLGLVPLGPVDPEILRHLRTALAGFLAMPVQLLPAKPLPLSTYHLQRNQYHSAGILEYLLEDTQLDSFQILGVTAADLYIPIFTFVFGEAQLDGKAALISTFRPGGGADGVLPPRRVFLSRLLKLSLHELGHTFALGHCRQPDCLMGFSANLEKLDLKDVVFCEYCRVLLNDYFNRFKAT